VIERAKVEEKGGTAGRIAGFEIIDHRESASFAGFGWT
jgi:hypothetical protein